MKLSKECKNRDIALTIDGTQSVGAMPIDIKKIMPDLLVVSGYKWCLGPYSLGAAYIDKKYHDLWINRDYDDPEAIDYNEYKKLTAKESGPHIAKYIKEWFDWQNKWLMKNKSKIKKNLINPKDKPSAWWNEILMYNPYPALLCNCNCQLVFCDGIHGCRQQWDLYGKIFGESC